MAHLPQPNPNRILSVSKDHMNPHARTSDTHNPDCLHWPIYQGELGSILCASSTAFTVWAPSATTVTLRLFHDCIPGSAPYHECPLISINDGAWRTEFQKRLDGTFYDYVVSFADGQRRVTPDPWAKACGINGERSLVIDDSALTPSGWDEDVAPDIAPEETVIWETHVGDFSNDPHGGFIKDHRGRYLAFTDMDTRLDVGTGTTDDYYPTGVAYLRRLGVTHVQIMPFYDFGSVDEATRSTYNWGYDPVTYDAPEGSYSTDPYDGARRILECRSMIESLHRNGFRVIMDVVYNHMYRPDNPFERMAPGYFCRRDANGELSNGSGCGNDMASEKPMFRRFIVDSIMHWARDYHTDGFRFDLMGLIDVDTLNQTRHELDQLPGGHDILMFGEPWAAGDTAVDDTVVLGDKDGRLSLDPRIGWFCDDTRDAVKGSVMDAYDTGYVNGRPDAWADAVFHAIDGWRDTDSAPHAPGQLIQYVSAHDDLTLWDKLCLSMRGSAVSESDFDASGSISDIMIANILAAGIVFVSAGIPFLLSGEEFARTKFGCDNSFESSHQLNMLDWARARRLGDLTSWYRRLIAIRRKESDLFCAPRTRLESPSGVVATRIGADLIVIVNATDNDCDIDIKEPSSSWEALADSQRDIPMPNSAAKPSSTFVESTFSHDDHHGSAHRLGASRRSFVLWRRRG